MIHSLTNGIALNKIQLSSKFHLLTKIDNLLSVHSMDLSNGGYVTLQGKQCFSHKFWWFVGYIRDDSIQESRTR